MTRILLDLFEETWREDYHIGVYPRDGNAEPAKEHNNTVVEPWFVRVLAWALEPDVTKGGNRGR